MRRRLLLLPAALVLTGCETLQDPEPTAKTVPVAALLFGAWAAIVAGTLLAIGRLLRRNRSAHLVRWPAWTAALAVGPALATGTAVVGLATVSVAFGYRESHHSLFSWDEMVGLTLILGGVFALAAAVSLGLAALFIGRSRRRLLVAQVVVAAPVVVGALAALLDGTEAAAVAGWSVPWVPALVSSFWRARPTGGPDLRGLPVPQEAAPAKAPVHC